MTMHLIFNRISLKIYQSLISFLRSICNILTKSFFLRVPYSFILFASKIYF